MAYYFLQSVSNLFHFKLAYVVLHINSENEEIGSLNIEIHLQQTLTISFTVLLISYAEL